MTVASRHDKSNWYVVRAKPGTQRMAKAIDGLPPHRIGESIIERNLRSDGIDVYMPAFWLATKHRRTNKIIKRRLPFLVGYVIVNLPSLDFERVRSVDGVMCFLQSSRESGPLRFSEADMRMLLLEEFDETQRFQFGMAQHAEAERLSRRDALHGQLRRFIPRKGRAVRFNVREQAQKAIQSLPDGLKQRVLGIIKELDTLESCERLAPVDAVA